MTTPLPQNIDCQHIEEKLSTGDNTSIEFTTTYLKSNVVDPNLLSYSLESTILSAPLPEHKVFFPDNINTITHDNTSHPKAEFKFTQTTPSDLEFNSNSNYEILVLSGGGKKGIVQLGVLHAMCINGVIDFTKLQSFVGTSVGSIICFLLIINYLPVEILSHICSKGSEIKPQINFLELMTNFGMQSIDSMFTILEKITEDKIGFLPTMSELYELYGKHFICVTHNLSADTHFDEQETVYIDHISHPNLSCIEAIKMSSNIPLVFSKYIYDKNYYVDGALSDNYPIIYTSNRFPDKKILGICIDRPSCSIKGVDDKKVNIMDYMKCLLAISYKMNTTRSRKYVTENIHSLTIVVDEPDEFKFDMSVSSNFQLFSIGYQNGVKLIKKNKMDSKSEGGVLKVTFEVKSDSPHLEINVEEGEDTPPFRHTTSDGLRHRYKEKAD